jgi:hypothetical protein
MSKLEDLSGRVFGKLTVLSRAHNQMGESGDERVQWMCRCECGAITVKPSRTLKAAKHGGCGECYKAKRPQYLYETTVNGFRVRVKGRA